MAFDVPVLFLIYKRSNTTRKVFERIKEIKPLNLFVAADGPKNENEKRDCEAVRKYVLENIDWPCEVKTLFREKNLGCGLAVSGAIDWFFGQVEQGIILEDDCLPELSFFNFCKILLEKYRNEEQIKIISGNNFQMGNRRGDGSYFFSAYSHIWGWATWKRTWSQYKFRLNYLDNQKVDQLLNRHFQREKEKIYWKKIFWSVKNEEVDTWAYPLSFSVWYFNGVNIKPNQNLVTNIGFGEDATHTKGRKSVLANLPLDPILDIKHPASIMVNIEADQFLFDHFIDLRRPLSVRIKRKFLQVLKRARIKTGRLQQFISRLQYL